MKLTVRVGTMIVVAGLGAAHSASAQFTPINLPDAAYLGGTSTFGISALDGEVLNSLSNAEIALGFSSDVAAWSVPTSWASWGAPPGTESPTPRVLGTQDTTLTLTLSNPAATFGFEAQPENGFVSPITATFFNGTDVLGTLSFDLDANGGARLFAGTSSQLFTSVEISSTDTFGIAQLRVGGVVPEPGTVALLIGAGVAALGLRRKSTVRKAV